MTLELSDEELRSLLHLTSLALYVAEQNQEEAAAEDVEALQQLADRIYELGAQEGHRDIAEFDAAAGQYMLKESYVEESFYADAIRQFEDDFFWSELAYALAERDLKQRGFTPEEDAVEYNQRLTELEDFYMDIFSEQGVDRLHVIPAIPHQ
jgi:hypothetical protein